MWVVVGLIGVLYRAQRYDMVSSVFVMFFRDVGLTDLPYIRVCSTRSMVVIPLPVLLFRNRLSFASSFLPSFLTSVETDCTGESLKAGKHNSAGTVLSIEISMGPSEIVFRFFFFC